VEQIITILFLQPRCQMGLVVNATPRPLYPRERSGIHYIGGCMPPGPVSTIRRLHAPRAGIHYIGGCMPPGPVSTVAENLAPTGIRSPDHPARSQSLYRLSCPNPQVSTYVSKYVPKFQRIYSLHLEGQHYKHSVSRGGAATSLTSVLALPVCRR
jgi:hypothetical protein